jgi:hypothetical protein
MRLVSFRLFLTATAAAFLALSAGASAKVLKVDQGDSIQAAVDEAAPGTP